MIADETVTTRLVMTTPLDMGSMPQMHSKQPQEVMGSSRMEYRVTDSTAPCVAFFTVSLTDS